MLTDKYNQVKYKLGRIPTILDFHKLGEIEPMLFINYAKTYDNFLRMVDKDYKITFLPKEEQILAFISALMIDGKRPHELLMLKMMIEDEFINNQIFSWMTRNGVSLDSRESEDIINYKQTGLKICLLIKKSDGEGTDFYYMGEVEPIKWNETTIRNNKGKNKGKNQLRKHCF